MKISTSLISISLISGALVAANSDSVEDSTVTILPVDQENVVVSDDDTLIENEKKANKVAEVADPEPEPEPILETKQTVKTEEERQFIKDRVGALFYDNGVYNLEAIDTALEQCEVVQNLNAYIQQENEDKSPSFIERLFTSLFPFGPGLNALLATTYISGPPNFLLALVSVFLNCF